jgi:hypothetical protein
LNGKAFPKEKPKKVFRGFAVKGCPSYGLAKFKFSQVSSSGYLKTPQPGLDLASVIVCCVPIVLPSG